MITALFLVAASTAQCTIPAAEEQRQLQLAYEQFDSEPSEFGWRQLNGKHCTDTAVKLLGSYASAAPRLATA